MEIKKGVYGRGKAAAACCALRKKELRNQVMDFPIHEKAYRNEGERRKGREGRRERKDEAVGAWGPIASPAAVRLLLGLQYHLFHYTIS